MSLDRIAHLQAKDGTERELADAFAELDREASDSIGEYQDRLHSRFESLMDAAHDMHAKADEHQSEELRAAARSYERQAEHVREKHRSAERNVDWAEDEDLSGLGDEEQMRRIAEADSPKEAQVRLWKIALDEQRITPVEVWRQAEQIGYTDTAEPMLREWVARHDGYVGSRLAI